MSSETSTDAQLLVRHPETPRERAPFQAWQLFTLAALISASAVALRAGYLPSSVRVALILTVFAAGAIGVAALRTLLPFASGRGPSAPAIIGGRTRAALEREKTLVLRSIKELEFDRAMGKVSEKDFSEMSARLRARAMRILRQLDAGTGYRAEIESEITRRLAQPAAAVATAVEKRAPAESGDEEASAGRLSPAATMDRDVAACGSCGTRNDADARFCKACGARLGAA
ncbi:MAG TPA: zinc ribbon domain-containing protein [Vicinamibacterales bacterium]|nr:zinc ribbon domain-containing protein [Vicinamibacterales bacterium]